MFAVGISQEVDYQDIQRIIIHLIILRLLELDLIRCNFKTFTIQGKLNIYKVIIPPVTPPSAMEKYHLPETGQNQERSQQSSKQ